MQDIPGFADPIDSFERIALNGKDCVLVFASNDYSRIELLDYSEFKDAEATQNAYAARGLRYAALCGTIDGQGEIAMVSVIPESAAFTIGAAVRAFIDGARAEQLPN